MVTLEICAQSLQAAINAYHGGAHRIELCIDLPTGGLTPSAKLIKQVKKEIDIPVFVLIRCRAGNFVYTKTETNRMCSEIDQSIDTGADGIVCGALLKDNILDKKSIEAFIKSSQGLPITFHRAIEKVNDIFASIDLLVDYGIQRILYGGKSGNAFTNRNELVQVNNYINDRMILLAGSGVNSKNAKELIKTANLQEIHASAKYGTSRNNTVNEFDSDTEEVRRLAKNLTL